MRRLKGFVLWIVLVLSFILPIQAKSKIDESMLQEIQGEVGSGQLAYGNGQYVYLTDYESKVFISTDGKQWREEKAILSENGLGLHYYSNNIKRMIWDGKQFIVPIDDRILTSTDGVVWNNKPLIDHKGNPLNFNIMDLAYINGVYTFVGSPVPVEQGLYFATAGFLYSTDLKAFYEGSATNVGESIGGTRPVEELLVGPNKILGFGTDETIMITKDGKSWDGKKGTFVGGKGIWDGSKYVTAYGDKIYTSQDGVSWKMVYQCKNTAAPWLRQVAYNGKHYIATGTVDGKNSKRDWIYYFSKDGVNWEERIVPAGNMNVYDVQGTKDGFVVVGNKIYLLQTLGAVSGKGGSNEYKPAVPKKPQGYGQLSTQTGESIRDLVQGQYDHYMAISDNHNLYEWGSDLGKTYEAIGIPRKILSNVRQAIPSWRHAGAITFKDELYMWGDNANQGILDTGDVKVIYPTKVMDDVKDAAINGYATYVVKNNGELYVKGRYSVRHAMFGQVGGSAEDRMYDSFTKIADQVRDVETTGISSGYITNNHDLYMWGWNSEGNLGDGTLEDRMEPVKVLSNVKKFMLNLDGVMALTHKGEVYVWGEVGYMLGLGRENVTKPYKMMKDVKDIFYAEDKWAVTKTTGQVLTWEFVENKNRIPQYSKPKELYKNAEKIQRNFALDAILTRNGQVQMHGGTNNVGQLGDGTTQYQNADIMIKVKGFKARPTLTKQTYNQLPKQSLYQGGKKIIGSGIFQFNGKTYVGIRQLADMGLVQLSTNLFGEYTLVHPTTKVKATFTQPIVIEVDGKSYMPLRDMANGLGYQISPVVGGIEIN